MSHAVDADGTVRSYFTAPNTTPSIRAACLDAAGKVVAVSSSTAAGVFRMNLDGSLDTSFSNNTYNNALTSLLIQSDGRILVGGTFTLVNGAIRPSVVRLNTNGTLDGVFPTNIGGTGVEVLAPGSGGKFYAGKVNGYGLQRYDANGVLDSSFTAVGIGTGQINGRVIAVRELADGKVMVSHQIANPADGTATGRKLERLTATGAIDPSFTAPAFNAPVHGFDILPDGRVAIVGEFTLVGGVSRVRLALLQADGSLDTSFNPGSGMEFFSTAPHFGVRFLDDRLYFHGDITTVNGTALRGLARLNLDGSLDTTFAIGAGANGRVYALTPAANGDLFVGGGFTTINAQACYHAGYLARTVAVADPFLAYLIQAGVPEAKRAAEDDADGDGLTNLMEYALDLNPMAGDNAGLPTVSKDGLLTLTYPHAHEDVTYTVETSTDLTAGSWTSAGVDQGTLSPAGTTTASIPAGDQRRFLRLTVSR